MMRIGQDVITMGAPGRFRVVAVDKDQVTIENGDGLRKVVMEWNLRSVEPSPAR